MRSNRWLHQTSHVALSCGPRFIPHKINIVMRGLSVILHCWSKHLIQRPIMTSLITNCKSLKFEVHYSWNLLQCDTNCSILCDLILAACHKQISSVDLQDPTAPVHQHSTSHSSLHLGFTPFFQCSSVVLDYLRVSRSSVVLLCDSFLSLNSHILNTVTPESWLWSFKWIQAIHYDLLYHSSYLCFAFRFYLHTYTMQNSNSHIFYLSILESHTYTVLELNLYIYKKNVYTVSLSSLIF